jgi:hypothetical protein
MNGNNEKAGPAFSRISQDAQNRDHPAHPDNPKVSLTAPCLPRFFHFQFYPLSLALHFPINSLYTY